MKRSFFTIIEMMVVIAILLFLMSSFFVAGFMLFPKYQSWQAENEILAIENALNLYNQTLQTYPPDYKSSTRNEDARLGSLGIFDPIKADFGSMAAVQTYIDDNKDHWKVDRIYSVWKYNETPSNLVKYCVAAYDWRDDVGGTIPSRYTENITEEGLDDEIDKGYVCPNKQIITSVGQIQKKLRLGSSKNHQMQNCNISGDFIVAGKALACTAKRCGLPIFKCENHDPNSDNYSCGWHNNNPEMWEGWHRDVSGGVTDEGAKALYDYLGRPMKGRMRNGEPVDERFIDAVPFLDIARMSLVIVNKPPNVSPCTGKLLSEDESAVMLYGDGVYDTNDSFKLVDPWGSGYMFTSNGKEYVASGDVSQKPYQIVWAETSSVSNQVSSEFDLVPPRFNKDFYDLGSMGADKAITNWIPFDLKFRSFAGYEYDSGASEFYKGMFVYGVIVLDSNGEFVEQIYGVKDSPSQALIKLDNDNDNITNFKAK